jgi:hypothetical protein
MPNAAVSARRTDDIRQVVIDRKDIKLSRPLDRRLFASGTRPRDLKDIPYLAFRPMPHVQCRTTNSANEQRRASKPTKSRQ